MKILGIVCSPRLDGNTSRLVEKVLEGAMRREAETEILHFGDLNVNPCRACNSCKRTGKCVQGDGMDLIYDALGETNVIVFGTPIYYDHISAQAKIFLDRLYFYSGGVYDAFSSFPGERGKSSFPKGLKAVVVITYEWDKPNVYNSVLEWIKKRFESYYGVETVATLKAHGTVKRPVTQRPDLLAEALAIGESLV